MKQELADAELNTYARQIVLSDIGYEGQLKLRNAKACIIGLGGLGSLIATKLVGMGIGELRIVDRDIVFRSDLHRQHLYDVDSVGLAKVEVAFQKLSRINPDVELVVFPESLTSYNATEIIAGADVVLDGLDRPEPRYIVNRTCNHYKIPYIYGAAIETFGNVSTIVPGQSLCLECFMPGLTEDDLPKCGVVGVHPSILGMVTSIQVFEAVSLLIGKKPQLLNKLLYFDLSQMALEIFSLSARKNCPICGNMPKSDPEPLVEKLVEESCSRDGQRNFVVSPRERIDIDLNQLGDLLKERGFPIITVGTYSISFEQSEEVTTSILKSGVMIVKTSPELVGYQKEDLLETYRSILIDGLGLPATILPAI
jgi:adenylyltransferase/sulfurtransferase